MHPVIGQCPICKEELIVARLYCPSCASAIEGRFSLGPLFQLSTEQLNFVITFIRCEGKLTRVQSELGVSYPTVRNRLEAVIKALGFEVGEGDDEPQGLTEEERRAILADLKSGSLSSEEALSMLYGNSPSIPLAE